MGYTDNSIFNAAITMDAFGDANGAAFKDTKAVGYFATLKTLLAEANESGSLRRASGSAKESSVAHKGVLKRAVTDNLRAIARTARWMAGEDAAFVNEFILPPETLNYQKTLEYAHAFADQGASLETDFKDYGLPVGTFQELSADTAALEQANRQKGESGTESVGANHRLDEVLKGILDARRGIDVIARNLFAAKPSKLAEWLTASHVEYSSKRTPPVKSA